MQTEQSLPLMLLQFRRETRTDIRMHAHAPTPTPTHIYTSWYFNLFAKVQPKDEGVWTE